MAFARVVSFDGVDADHMRSLKQQIESGEQPEDIPATEIMILHDAGAEQALAIVFFETEDDYRRGDAALDAMPRDDTPGRRSSVTKYEVALRMTS
jgi:hypothetical protein